MTLRPPGPLPGEPKRDIIVVFYVRTCEYPRGTYPAGPLTELGRKQAVYAAEAIQAAAAGEPVVVFRADLAPRRETANLIARTLELEPIEPLFAFEPTSLHGRKIQPLIERGIRHIVVVIDGTVLIRLLDSHSIATPADLGSTGPPNGSVHAMEVTVSYGIGMPELKNHRFITLGGMETP